MQSQVVRSFLGRTERGPLGLFGLDAPSGGDRRSLKRDLDDGRRILLRRPGVAEIRAIDKKSREVEIVASTSGVKRDGNAIYHSDAAWDFTNFAKVPAMLWSHDYGSAFAPPGLPTGFWRSWGIEKYKGSKALCMRGYLEDDEFPEKIWRRIQSGSIRAVSIGWNPLKFEELLDDTGQQAGWVFTLNELYECSWVVIGADPDAGVRNSIQAYEGLTEQELDAFNGRRVHEFSRGVAYVLDHREAPTELVRSLRTKSGVALMDMEALSMDESPSVVQAEAVPVEPAVYPVATPRLRSRGPIEAGSTSSVGTGGRSRTLRDYEVAAPLKRNHRHLPFPVGLAAPLRDYEVAAPLKLVETEPGDAGHTHSATTKSRPH